VSAWLANFRDDATRSIGLVDRSVIALFEAQRDLQRHRRVYIWSLDTHLSGYDTGHQRPR
jgi:hypothetical protein